VEKPDPGARRAFGGTWYVSMNCWLFTPAIFDACRGVAPSVRGELELPQAVQHLIDGRGTRFVVVPVHAPVLDLSSRADIPAVAARLGGVRSACDARGRLADLLDPEGVAERLDRAGLPSGERPRCGPVAGVRGGAAATGAPPEAPAHAFVVPGRIEVLGKHTDYAGGRSLLAAADRGFVAVAVPGADRRVRVLDVRRDETVAFDLDPELEPAAGWANYPTTAARRLARTSPRRAPARRSR
jgi:hypothetical protein